MKFSLFFLSTVLVLLGADANLRSLQTETATCENSFNAGRCDVGGQVLMDNPETKFCGVNPCNRQKCCVDVNPEDPPAIPTCENSFDAGRCAVGGQVLMDNPGTKLCGKNACNRKKCCVDCVVDVDCDDNDPGTIDTCSLGACSNVDPCVCGGTDNTCSTTGVCSGRCETVNGLLWCKNPATGISDTEQSCNSVCASLGLTPVLDFDAILNAQNDAIKCQSLADAFDIPPIELGTGFATACAAISLQFNVVSMFCSQSASCPEAHLTSSDGGVSVSVCPCE